VNALVSVADAVLALLVAAAAVALALLLRRQERLGAALRMSQERVATLEAGSSHGAAALAASVDGRVAVDSAAAVAGSPPEPRADDFAMLVSHDLRAPIRVVEGFTRIVKEDYGHLLDPIGIDHLDRVVGAAGRMNLMIDALLSLSRLSTQPVTRAPVDLSQLAGYIVEDLRKLHPERGVSVEIEPGMVVFGDPTLLRMALENLLGNAWKYTGHTPHPRVVFCRGETPASYTVRDNGAGFDMRYADRLFGVFQRLHSASEFPGTGIGLASVREIVRLHGGEIHAEGEPERGASFHFSLLDGIRTGTGAGAELRRGQ
jgi:light-regulated signal transduction histidine kinase (bacteriophytochrome)